MKKLISIIILAVVGTKAIAKPHCQNFNNYDDRVTITFTDDKVGKRYDVTDVVFIPSFFGDKLSATSVKVTIKDGVATVVLTFPHVIHFSNPKVTLKVNGKKARFDVCQ
ncbi:MAG: hypothetical protein IJV36_04880 [Prevotella sp.]|nr:hypothetical protein [Prevotella sp.]